MATERMIPLLPCGSIKEMLDFYTDLGFTVTYQQKAPNVYEAMHAALMELPLGDEERHVLRMELEEMTRLFDDPAA